MSKNHNIMANYLTFFISLLTAKICADSKPMKSWNTGKLITANKIIPYFNETKNYCKVDGFVKVVRGKTEIESLTLKRMGERLAQENELTGEVAWSCLYP